MDGALWGGREHRKGHMCLGRLEQSEVSNYYFPDYLWHLIAEFVIDKKGYNKMSQGHFNEENPNYVASPAALYK